MKILLVDDDLELGTMLSEYLGGGRILRHSRTDWTSRCQPCTEWPL